MRIRKRPLRNRLLLFLLLVLSNASAWSQDLKSDPDQFYSTVNNSIDLDLADSKANYKAVESVIQREKTGLSRQLLSLESENQTLRDSAKQLGLQRDGVSLSYEDMKQEMEDLQSSVEFIENLLKDYSSSFHREVPVGEKSLYQEQMTALLSFKNEEDVELKVQDIAQGFLFLDSIMDRSFNLFGGYSYQNKAILQNGLEATGNFVQVGPYAFFKPLTDKGAGLIDSTQNYRARVILPKPKMKEAEIQEVVSTKQGWLYFDPTLYNAIEISRIESNWLDEIEKGGLWIFPILFFALLSVLVAISKFFQIYTVRRPSLAQLKELSENLQKGDRNTLEQLEVLKIKGPIGEMLQTFVKYSGERKELIEEILYERLLEAQSSLERFLPLIAITMATAPLLGLLGTVTGMIETFKQIMLFGSSDMGNLAGGISEALVTTKYGLVSAIPALIIHSLLTRKVQGILSDMEKMGSSLLNTMQVKENASVDP